jgi:hypothetical protein
MFAFAGPVPSCFDMISDVHFLHNACHPTSDNKPGKYSHELPKPGTRADSV